MTKPLDLIGKVFGRLTVLSRASNDKYRRTRWNCRCECGNEVVVKSGNLLNNHTKSCGCLRDEVIRSSSKIHGHSPWHNAVSPTYKTWASMIERCTNPNSKSYAAYGDKGITVCKEWHNFENFLRDMGERPEGTTIDRKDNNLGYYKDNCKWSTKREQANNMTTNINISIGNKTQTLAMWVRELNLNYSTVYHRLKIGWTPERALELTGGAIG